MSSGSWQALGKRQRAESDSGFGYLFPDIPAILIEKERGAESPANTDRTENKGDGKELLERMKQMESGDRHRLREK